MVIIKIRDIEIEKMLNIQSEAGKNHLSNMRVIFLNTEAIGLLRKDLICTLGTEQAKGFLTRYGFACGYYDALGTMKNFPLDDQAESYRLGAHFHTLVGMADVTPIEIRCNDNKYRWYFEGIFKNSYEAEEHVKHFGPSKEPVCWSLVGYAGGFRSAYLGERVIYKEVTCHGKGDPYCRFIGKTVADWGEEIIPDLAYYQETNLGEALEQANMRIQAQNEILKQSAAIHEKLTQMVLEGKDLSAIARILGKIIGGAIIVVDRFFHPLTLFFPSELMESNYIERPSILIKEIFTDWRYRQYAEMLTKEKRPVLLSEEINRKPFTRLVAPIVIGQDILGYVCSLKEFSSFTEMEQMALERAATVFALKMMQARAVAEVEIRLKGDFVDDLITGNFDSETTIIERARLLGYDLKQPHFVLIINVDSFMNLVKQFNQDEREVLQFKTKLSELINRVLKGNNTSSLVSVKSVNIIVLAAKSPNQDTLETLNLARVIQNQVKNKFPQFTISVGIGGICISPKDFSRSYREAQWTMDIIQGLKQNDTILAFENLGTYGLLFHASDQKDLITFMKKQLGPLIDYDAKCNTQLVETLNHFFENDGNLIKAAAAATVSVSGFKYRLQKICDIGCFSLKDPNKKFDLQMALKIWLIVNPGMN